MTSPGPFSGLLVIDLTKHTIYVGATSLQTGDAVTYYNAGGVSVGGPFQGLLNAQVYYVIRLANDPNRIQLAATLSDALLGNPYFFGDYYLYDRGTYLGVQVNLASYTELVNTHLRDYLLGQFGNAVSIGLTALTTVLQILLMFVVAFLLALDATSVRRVLRRIVPNDYRTDFDQIWRRVRRIRSDPGSKSTSDENWYCPPGRR